MVTTLDECVARLCDIPDDYHGYSRPGLHLSFNDLVERAGFDTWRSAVDVAVLARNLRAHPELIERWLRFSEDQRSSEAPFFLEQAGGYSVGYLSRDLEAQVFDDPASA